MSAGPSEYDSKFMDLITHMYNFSHRNLELFPILVFFVVVANVLVAIVLSKKHMITPTNVVLKYMAIADLCVGLVPLPWTFFYHTLRFNMHEDQLKLWWCYMYKYSMDAVPPVCHNIAMWLTVLLAGQRQQQQLSFAFTQFLIGTDYFRYYGTSNSRDKYGLIFVLSAGIEWMLGARREKQKIYGNEKQSCVKRQGEGTFKDKVEFFITSGPTSGRKELEARVFFVTQSANVII
uniref:G-protein coupled receptors family 1 profile domain-containing protein n=1 Tax=Parascaris equorum TaxID=6256 RepID=A0A914RT15_PAREQ